MRLRELLSRAKETEWAVAYRIKIDGEILKSNRQYFNVIKNSLRYWCADPFPVEEGTKTYIFFEAFDRFKRKGVIGYREICGNKAEKIHIIIEEPFHISYPYIYNDCGNWYIIPESKDANKILRYKSKEFPNIWEREKVLIDNISAVDTTVYSYSKNEMILFAYIWESFNKGELLLLDLRDNDTKNTICKIEDLNGRKRPAGKICLINDFYYRPSQLCTRTYGEAIIFNRIQSLTENSYEEIESKDVCTKDICLDRSAKITGVHTYNNSEHWEVIDVEIGGISPIRIIGFVARVYSIVKRTIKVKRKESKDTER